MLTAEEVRNRILANTIADFESSINEELLATFDVIMEAEIIKGLPYTIISKTSTRMADKIIFKQSDEDIKNFVKLLTLKGYVVTPIFDDVVVNEQLNYIEKQIIAYKISWQNKD